MFLIEREQIVESKSIVTGHEVDALFWGSTLSRVDIRASNQSLLQVDHCVSIGLEETPNIITEAAVPIFPAISTEDPYQVEATRIPGLRNQFFAREHRIGIDFPKNRSVIDGLSMLVSG